MSNARMLSGIVAILLVGACGAGDTVAADSAKAAADSMSKTDTATASVVTEEPILKSSPSGSYDLDKSHTYINFSFSHLGFSNPVIGFRDFDVEFSLDNENLSNSSLNVNINVDSIDSGTTKFDKHLVSEDMFDTAKFPKATFTATDFVMTAADKMDITGDLTIKDVTRSVVLNTKINKAANHPMSKVPTIGISASTTIKRSDFGVSYATPHVGDEVKISIEAEMPQAK